MKRTWKVKEKIPDHIFKQFADLHPLTVQLLHNRGLTSTTTINQFLNPKYEELSSPFDLLDMDKAVVRILSAIDKKEKITIYADYDADAVTACAVLYYGLQAAGATDVSYYIPDRFAEGYGVNSDAVEQIASNGTKLIITVDCGINSRLEVEKANKLGVDVVVTDHHHIIGDLPNARAVVNPKRNPDRLELQGLTGAGVAFKLVQGLLQQSKSPHIVPQWEKWLLDLVALGTVADCQSLLGENRILVRYGLQVLPKSRWLGLQQLMRTAGLDPSRKPDTFTLGFIIAPRINAASRIQHGELALKLLITNDLEEAGQLASQLEQLNQHRKRITEQIVSEARSQIELQQANKVLLAVGDDWPKGIVGLVASRLSEEFQRPAVVLERSNGYATGSARSFGSFNLVEALTANGQILERFGGHAQAAGLTLTANNVHAFHRGLLAFADSNLLEDNGIRQIVIDAHVEPSEITQKLVEELKQFEPFGPDNPSPTFLLSGLMVQTMRTVGSTSKHLKLTASKSKTVVSCIGFNQGYRLQHLQPGDNVDVVVEPSENSWNGRSEVQLKIVDIKKA